MRPLTLKMVVMVCGAMLAALLSFGAAQAVGEALVEHVYLSEEAVNARLQVQIAAFRDYVRTNAVSSTGVKAIGAWNREHRLTQMTVYGLNTTVNSGPNGAELVVNDSGIVIRTDQAAEGTEEFPVNFRDGVFPVMIYENTAALARLAVNTVSVFVAAVVFLIILIFYERHITRLIRTLSRQVQLVSRGDLQRQIVPQSTDEIGQLARDVDARRLSIIDKLQREEAALQANSQLITAISHDVRTPLTALMGYLEILSDESIDPMERQAYLEVCKNNAQRLKSLTDELFGFFLVFGKPTPDLKTEEFDAATLVDQILLEHEMDLHQHDFRIEARESGDPTGKLRVDLGHMRRIFDNLFSNILKYADPEQPVVVDKIAKENTICIRISNAIPAHAARVESNRIGLQTCQKLTEAMGGSFLQERTGDSFTAGVELPLYRGDTSAQS